MADKLIHIPNDYKQNNPYCWLQLVLKRLGTLLNEPTYQYLIKVPKLLC